MKPYLFFALLLIGCTIGCTNQPEQTDATPKTDQTPVAEQKKEQPKVEPKPQPPINAEPITNFDLWFAFKNKPLDAHKSYTEKYLLITGSVKSFSQQREGWQLGFSGGESGAIPSGRFARMSEKEKNWWLNGYPPNIVCTMRPGEEKKAPSGKVATIVGKCLGPKQAEAFGGFIIEVVDARFVTPE